jgi:UDP-GlcNAc:undecaprenyl-phosphate GlcNAc-1-phosphate transferase
MQQLLLNIGPLALAFGLCVGLIVLLIRPARAWGWVDKPTTRKHHRTPVPLVGGVAMGVAYGLSVLALPEKPYSHWELLSAMALLTSIGLYDDLRATRPAVRFVFQIGAGLVMALGGGIVLISIGDLLGLGDITLLGGIALLFTLFCVVGVINAFNMSDGLDGLAGGMALIAAGWLIVLLQMAPASQRGDSDALLALVMVIAGFLCFNLRHPWRARASVFMGDAGSTLLGFVLAWFLVHLSQGPEAVMAPMTAVWILALPLMDTIAVMIHRIRAGCSPFAADRQHLHHLLLGYGLSDGQATALLLVMALLSGAVGVAAHGLGAAEHLQFYAFLALFGLYYGVTARLCERHRLVAPPPAAAETVERRRAPSSKTVTAPAVSHQKPARNEGAVEPLNRRG